MQYVIHIGKNTLTLNGCYKSFFSYYGLRFPEEWETLDIAKIHSEITKGLHYLRHVTDSKHTDQIRVLSNLMYTMLQELNQEPHCCIVVSKIF